MSDKEKIEYKLERIGIKSELEALLISPTAYKDYKAVETHLKGSLDRFLLVKLRLNKLTYFPKAGQTPLPKVHKGVVRVLVDAEDMHGQKVRFYALNDLPTWKRQTQKSVAYVYGQLKRNDDLYALYYAHLVPEEDTQKILPIYEGKRGIIGAKTIKNYIQLIKGNLDAGANFLLERSGMSNDQFFKAYLISARELLKQLHWPSTLEQAEGALAIVRKVTVDTIANQVLKARIKPKKPSSVIDISVEQMKELISYLPFELTLDQKRAIWDIMKDLSSVYPMRRILSGDVGTGKTLAFMLPAVGAHLNDARVGIIAPGQLLVKQLAREFRACFPHVPVKEVYSGIKSSENTNHAITIGTTALLHDQNEIEQGFDFLISDEQHKFSIEQRNLLLKNGANLLEATATAIPRTVALVEMGGFDVSILKQSPVEKNITTSIVQYSQRRQLYNCIKNEIVKGGQVVIIYPLVSSDATDQTVESAMKRFANHFGDRVGLLHGQLKSDEKSETIQKMMDQQIDILISSTVIEVGITLPDLRVVVVVNPEYFGVSQLHQLRGRLARKGGDGHFFLYLHNIKPRKSSTLERFQLLVDFNDGFELANRDAKIRGVGEVFEQVGNQTGETRSLFHGVNIEYEQIAKVVEQISCIKKRHDVQLFA